MKKEVFQNEYVMLYSDMDTRLKMKPSRIADIFQELAIQHSASVGYDLEWFAGNKKGWALLFWHIVIKRLPSKRDFVSIGTWARPYKRAQANRSFLMETEKGEELICAETRWTLMDTERRRPSKLEPGFFDAYHIPLEPIMPEEKFDMPVCMDVNFVTERKTEVTRRDTDTNGHVNNAVYIEWALDDVPDEIYENYSLIDIKAAYRRECRKGATIKCQCYARALSEKKTEISTCFTDAENEKIVFSQVSAIWEKP